MHTQTQDQTDRRRDKRRRARRAIAQSRGMTLIEIMVVLAIISLILGGVGVVAFNQFKNAQTSDAKNQTVQIQQVVEQFMLQKKGKCPKSLQEVKAAGIASKVTKDPWGNDWTLKCPGEHSVVDVISAGPDGELGNEDDITNYDDESDAKAEDK